MTLAAFFLSALIHAAAIATYPLLFGPRPLIPVTSVLQPRAEPHGTEVIQLVEITGEVPDVAEPVDTKPIEEPDAPDVEPLDVGLGTDTPVEEPIPVYEAPALSAADRLRLLLVDPRLWPDLPAEITEVPRERLAELQLIWAIEDAADSAAAAEAAAEAALDWTYKDDQGRRWGISPGALHLGDITLPLPSFGAPYGSLAAQRSAEDAELARAARSAVVYESLKERAKAIRERKDRERAKRLQAQPPDTTGSGGSSRKRDQGSSAERRFR